MNDSNMLHSLQDIEQWLNSNGFTAHVTAVDIASDPSDTIEVNIQAILLSHNLNSSKSNKNVGETIAAFNRAMEILNNNG